MGGRMENEGYIWKLNDDIFFKKKFKFHYSPQSTESCGERGRRWPSRSWCARRCRPFPCQGPRTSRQSRPWTWCKRVPHRQRRRTRRWRPPYAAENNDIQKWLARWIESLVGKETMEKPNFGSELRFLFALPIPDSAVHADVAVVHCAGSLESGLLLKALSSSGKCHILWFVCAFFFSLPDERNHKN